MVLEFDEIKKKTLSQRNPELSQVPATPYHSFTMNPILHPTLATQTHRSDDLWYERVHGFASENVAVQYWLERKKGT